MSPKEKPKEVFHGYNHSHYLATDLFDKVTTPIQLIWEKKILGNLW